MASVVTAILGCRAEPWPFEAPVLRDHQEVEVVVADGAATRPLIFAGLEKIALCFQVDPTRDTSRFEMRLTVGGQPSPDGFVAPYVRSGETLCFKGALPTGLPPGRLRACGRLVDRYDGREYRAPCQTVAHRLDDDEYRALLTERERLLGRAFDLDLATLLLALDDLAARARDAELPVMWVQIELIAVHFLTLEGKPASRQEARRRLDALPEWIEQPAAFNLGAMAAYQSALLQFDSGGHLENAWVELSRADELYRRIADPKRFTVAMEEASILHQLGAVDEAVHRLRDALGKCGNEPSRCNRVLLESARSNLAWYILLNPNASQEELAEAEAFILHGLALLSPGENPLEYAHRLINLAYLDLRQREDPTALLEESRSVLAELRLDTEFVPYLLDWADLVAGLAALAEGDSAAALEACTALADRPQSQLIAWAFSCVARAHRRQGNLGAAEKAIEQALLHHAYGSSRRVAQHRTIGPGYRAEEFARAARLAIESKKPGIAWDLMLRLDQFSTDERSRRFCREKATGRFLDEWQAIEAETGRILTTLQELEMPASENRRFEQEQSRRELKTRLERLRRNWPGCEALPVIEDTGVDYRAFTLEDEIILLRRRDGKVTVEKRTPYSRLSLRRDIDEIAAILDRQEMSDAAWRRRLEPLAEALLPRFIADIEPVVIYALHGLLQGVPLTMLPLPDNTRGEWLAEVTAVAVSPAGSRAAPHRPAEMGQPLFVVDPRRDLPATPRLLRDYRELFPRAHYLIGEAATLTAFRDQLPRAAWLHVDAHGLYDPAFPKLSALKLADRLLYWVQLAETSMTLSFAHLSGCHTGRWPITADSGSYGIAGLVTRLGVGWAIASRTELDDRVAEDFNRFFYRAIAAGDTVPTAYQHALRQVIELHPAGDWGGLLLLSAAGAR